MRIAGIVLAVVIVLFALRLITTAFQTALSGKLLVRKGFRSHWQPAPNMNEAWKSAFRDGVMGILLLVLAFAMLF